MQDRTRRMLKWAACVELLARPSLCIWRRRRSALRRRPVRSTLQSEAPSQPPPRGWGMALPVTLVVLCHRSRVPCRLVQSNSLPHCPSCGSLCRENPSLSAGLAATPFISFTRPRTMYVSPLSRVVSTMSSAQAATAPAMAVCRMVSAMARGRGLYHFLQLGAAVEARPNPLRAWPGR